MALIKIYSTFPNEKEARLVAEHLLKKKLIACANFFPVKSIFRWEGKIQNENETACLFTALDAGWIKVKTEIKKMHSYDLPVIVRIEAESNEEYEEWVRKETS